MTPNSPTLLEMNYGIRPILGEPMKYEVLAGREPGATRVGLQDLASFVESQQAPFTLLWGTMELFFISAAVSRRWAAALRGDVLLGVYLHKKGTKYRVTGLATDSTNVRAGTEVVKYFGDAEHGEHTRIVPEFQEPVMWPDGVLRPRFLFLPQ